MGNVEPYDYPVGRGIFGRSVRSQDFEDLALYEQFFVGQRDGFFVEMGALDGITLSNTFAFEDKLGWSGVLLEANPRACRTLFRNRPRAIKLCTAVSMNHSWLTFQDGLYVSTFGDPTQFSDTFAKRFHPKRSRPRQQYEVPSAPLGQLLRAVGVSHIDLFSLDVEGSEYRVLQTFDWRIPVRVWCVEWNPEVGDLQTNASIAAIMRRHGYERHRWAHETTATRPLSQNQLWVWGGVWNVSTVVWQQWVPNSESLHPEPSSAK